MGFVALVAGRMMRSQRAPGWLRRFVWIGAAMVVLAGVLAVAGAWGPIAAASLWLGCVVLVLVALLARLRAMLVIPIVGLALGVASLFVVLGVASGVEATLIASLARLNGHAMISKYGLDFFEYEEVAARLEADPRVRAASPFVFGVGALVALPPDRDASDDPPTSSDAPPELDEDQGALEPLVVTIKGLDPARTAGFSGVDALFVSGGLEGLRPAEPRARPGAVLGTRLARRLGVGVGDGVRLVVPEAIHGGDDAREAGEPHHGEFEVTGLLDTGFAEFDATFVLIHISAAQALIYGEFRATGVEFELREVDALDQAMPVAEELAGALNRPRTDRGLLPHYRAASWAERSATLTAIRQTKAVLALVLALIVLVATGSLIGALLLLVRRKRREISTLAALGATRRQLFLAFEGVGIAVGVIGSLAGLALGALSLTLLANMHLDLDPTIYMVDELPVAFVFTDLLIPSALAVALCTVVTGPVAWQAAGLRPLDGLRARTEKRSMFETTNAP